MNYARILLCLICTLNGWMLAQNPAMQGKPVDATAPSVAGQSYIWNPVANGSTGAWTVQTKADVDARDIGVKCDGSTNDTPAIQLWIDSFAITRPNAVHYTGHTLRFPADQSANPQPCILATTLNIKGRNVKIDARGARFKCTDVNDTGAPCIIIGDGYDQGSAGIEWHGGQFESGKLRGTASVFVDNAQGTRFIDINAYGGTRGGPSFGHFIENWDDEKEEIDGLRMNGSGAFIRCDATYCGSALYAPGPFSGVGGKIAGISLSTNVITVTGAASGSIPLLRIGQGVRFTGVQSTPSVNGKTCTVLSTSGSTFTCSLVIPGNFAAGAGGTFAHGAVAGITSISNSDLGMQCGGNGIDWASGNDLYFGPGNIVQGFAQFGERIDRSSGYSSKLVLDQVYHEVGNCPNPIGNVGQAGLIVIGGMSITLRGGTRGGVSPRFGPEASGIYHNFYVVAVDEASHDSVPMPLGWAWYNNGAGGAYAVTWPRVTGASGYKLLAVRGGTNPDRTLPYGPNQTTGAPAPASLVDTMLDKDCAKDTCSMQYNPTAELRNYAPGALYSVQYRPKITFWPGQVVMVSSGSAFPSLDDDSREGPIVTNFAYYKPPAWNSIKSENGADLGPVIGAPTASPNYTGLGFETGLLLPGTSEPVNAAERQRKGKINFLGYSWNDTSFASDLITCRDSWATKTLAHAYLRPSADAADCALGIVGNSIGYLRAAHKWRFYFNTVPTGPGDANGIDLSPAGINLPSGGHFQIAGSDIETANLSTPGTGYVFLPGITIPNDTGLNMAVTATANRIQVVQFVLPTPIMVRKLTANVSTASAGQKFLVGVYSPTGVKLLETAISCGTLNATTTTLASPIKLPAGTYFYAYSASSAACEVTSTPIAAGLANMLQKNSVRLATASSLASGGAMPATLGTLTPASLTATPLVLLEP